MFLDYVNFTLNINAKHFLFTWLAKETRNYPYEFG